jgi:hypothetical protein
MNDKFTSRKSTLGSHRKLAEWTIFSDERLGSITGLIVQGTLDVFGMFDPVVHDDDLLMIDTMIGPRMDGFREVVNEADVDFGGNVFEVVKEIDVFGVVVDEKSV